MNFIFFSPHFPKNYRLFCQNLKQKGVNVLAIADQSYDSFDRNLKISFTEYYRVNDMNDYDEILKACGYFTHKYGKITHFESLNEHWLLTESKIRTDFNIPGFNLNHIDYFKKKSAMKDKFISANVRHTRGKVLKDINEVMEFVKDVGYPIIAKPNIGVGGSDTHKISSIDNLTNFFNNKNSIDYIFEEFINGDIYSFDGLTDNNGNIAFYGALNYSKPVLDIIYENSDLYYHTLREVPEELRLMGEKIVKEFNLRNRFFHIEFFKKDNKFIALEANLRPPGGFTIDMYNFAYDLDLYNEYSNIIENNTFHSDIENRYFCCYIGRKDIFKYRYNSDELKQIYSNNIKVVDRMPEIFSVMGNEFYIIRAKEIEKMHEIVDKILEKK